MQSYIGPLHYIYLFSFIRWGLRRITMRTAHHIAIRATMRAAFCILIRTQDALIYAQLLSYIRPAIVYFFPKLQVQVEQSFNS